MHCLVYFVVQFGVRFALLAFNKHTINVLGAVVKEFNYLNACTMAGILCPKYRKHCFTAVYNRSTIRPLFLYRRIVQLFI